MSKHTGLQFVLALVLLSPNGWSQGIMTTIAGTESVFNGDGKPALNAPLGRVSGLTLESSQAPRLLLRRCHELRTPSP